MVCTNPLDNPFDHCVCALHWLAQKKFIIMQGIVRRKKNLVQRRGAFSSALWFMDCVEGKKWAAASGCTFQIHFFTIIIINNPSPVLLTTVRSNSLWSRIWYLFMFVWSGVWALWQFCITLSRNLHCTCTLKGCTADDKCYSQIEIKCLTGK